MTKPTEKQLDKIRNAETKAEAWEAYRAIQDPALKEYKAIKQPAYDAYLNWKKSKLNYSNMSKDELIIELERRDNE